MAASVMKLMEYNEMLWEDKTAIANTVAGIQSLVEKTRGASLTQDKSRTEGYTEEKNNLLDRLTGNTHRLASLARAYAQMNENPRLEAQVDYSLWDLRDGSDEESLIRCENVVKAVSDVKDPLITEMQLDEALFTQVGEDITSVRSLIGERTDVQSTGSTATQNIKSNLSQLRKRFNILDNLIGGSITDEEFLSVYKNTRQIIDR